jgi:hypothetical protein
LKPWPAPSNRIRCPSCVLDGHGLAFTTKRFRADAEYGTWNGTDEKTVVMAKQVDGNKGGGKTGLYMHEERMSIKYDQKKARKAMEAEEKGQVGNNSRKVRGGVPPYKEAAIGWNSVSNLRVNRTAQDEE